MLIKQYDILFYKGDSFLSNIIRCITKSKYSHCGIFIDENHVVEINWNFKYKIRHIKYSKDKYDVYRCIANFDKNMMNKYIHYTIGQSYDFGELFRCLGFKLKDNKSKVICSECVFDAFEYAGIRLLDCDVVTPQDLTQSKYLVKIN